MKAQPSDGILRAEKTTRSHHRKLRQRESRTCTRPARATRRLLLSDKIAEISLTVKRKLCREHHHKITYDMVFRSGPQSMEEVENAVYRDRLG